MNFGPQHYVPVLKAKRGEKTALRNISIRWRDWITPLLEIVEWKEETGKSLEAHLDTAFKDLSSATSRYRRIFLDAREIEVAGRDGAAAVFERAETAGMIFTPVTGISRDADVEPALEHRSNGIALRICREDFEAGSLQREVQGFLKEHKVTNSEIDLIVDLGAVDDFVYDGVVNLVTAFIKEVPDRNRWRTLTLSACAFPKSMGVVERDSFAYAERNEWKAWRKVFFENRSATRLPTFSDCAIQHPTGVEGFDPRTMQVSATIRYALQERWLLVKGESTRFNRPGLQFPELARRLVYGMHRREYFGAGHCPGCAGMKDAADGAPKLGSAEAWRRLGTIHHISKTVESLSQLPWP